MGNRKTSQAAPALHDLWAEILVSLCLLYYQAENSSRPGKVFLRGTLCALRVFAVNAGLEFHREDAKHAKKRKGPDLVAAEGRPYGCVPSSVAVESRRIMETWW